MNCCILPLPTNSPVSAVSHEELLRYILPAIESISRSKSRPNHPDLDYEDLRSEGLLILSKVLDSCHVEVKTCNPKRRRIARKKRSIGMTLGRIKALVIVSFRNKVADLYRRLAVELKANSLYSLILFQNNNVGSGDYFWEPIAISANSEAQTEVSLLADIVCELGDEHVEVINMIGLGHSSRDIASKLELPRSKVRSMLGEVREALAA